MQRSLIVARWARSVDESGVTWTVVVIGGGVRKPEDQLDLFERIVDLVRRHAPDAAIAFNDTPGNIFDAAARWLDAAL